MSLNKFKAVSLKDKYNDQEEVLQAEKEVIEAELVAVQNEKKRAMKIKSIKK